MEKEHHFTGNLNFKANGKLLLTGEYLVIDGAAALALPLSLGQTLSASVSNSNSLQWRATDINGTWFEGDFSLNEFNVLACTDLTIATELQKILIKAKDLSPFKDNLSSVLVKTHLNFDRFLGLGSSSTLISLIASFFKVDKYKLHSLVSSGSGYDVACTEYDNPIIYKRSSKEAARISHINFNPPFADCMWFAYLGKKQDTNNEIARYKGIDTQTILQEISEISDITIKLAETKDLTNFVSLIELHEKIIGGVLGRTVIKQQQFSDFKGSMKSLGAWGGDFVMVVTDKGEKYLKDYLSAHDINTVFRFKDYVLNKPVPHHDEIIIRF